MAARDPSTYKSKLAKAGCGHTKFEILLAIASGRATTVPDLTVLFGLHDKTVYAHLYTMLDKGHVKVMGRMDVLDGHRGGCRRNIWGVTPKGEAFIQKELHHRQKAPPTHLS